jgi:chromosome partitioning protein
VWTYFGHVFYNNNLQETFLSGPVVAPQESFTLQSSVKANRLEETSTMRSIAVMNQKGGCGKTITSINLSAFLALQRRTLLVDLDPQAHATLGLTSNAVQPSRTMYDVLVPEAGRQHVALSDITLRISENLDLAPADILLSSVPEKLSAISGREDVLAKLIEQVGDQYDYVIVDCPPSVGLLTFNAAKACSEAIVPMDPSFFSLHGLGKIFETFDLLERETGHHITPHVLVTLYPGRSPFVRAVLEDVHKHLAGRHYQTFIRYSVKLAEAASHGLPITQYSKQCVGYDDYRALAEEVLAQEVVASSEEAVSEQGETSQSTRNWIEPPGAIITPEGVVFTVEAPAAERVQLVGDFNDWTTEGNEMQHDGRFWRKVVPLGPGRYLYRFVVDGQWRQDPMNQAVEPGRGGFNSVLVLEGERARAAAAN